MDIDYTPTKTVKAFMQSDAKMRVLMGPVGCLAPETLVVTEYGLLPIADINRPMRVLSWNDKTCRFQLSWCFLVWWLVPERYGLFVPSNNAARRICRKRTSPRLRRTACISTRSIAMPRSVRFPVLRRPASDRFGAQPAFVSAR